MKRAIVVVALAGLLALAGCAQAQNSASSTAGGSSSSSASSSQAEVGSGSSATGASPAASPAVATSAESEEAVIVITAGDASRELVGKLQDGPVTVSLHAYGGFEHVGPLPWSLPQNDEQVTSIPGDVMLYQGDQITIFHGSNSWAYTPLGHIEGATADSLLAAFGDGDADVMLSIAGN